MNYEIADPGALHMLAVIDGDPLPDHIARDIARLSQDREAIQYDLDSVIPF